MTLVERLISRDLPFMVIVESTPGGGLVYNLVMERAEWMKEKAQGMRSWTKHGDNAMVILNEADIRAFRAIVSKGEVLERRKQSRTGDVGVYQLIGRDYKSDSKKRYLRF